MPISVKDITWSLEWADLNLESQPEHMQAQGQGLVHYYTPPAPKIPFFCRNEGLGHPGQLPGRIGGGRGRGERSIWGPEGSWDAAGLTFTSQMLMPPSMPVVQNCEHFALPPLSTEIWL